MGVPYVGVCWLAIMLLFHNPLWFNHDWTWNKIWTYLNQGFHDSKFNWDLLCEDVHHFLSWTVPETNSDQAPFKKCW